MGYYHLSANIISRGNGQSAVACASYRSGEKLWCEDDQEHKFYGKRTVDPDTYILAPEHAPEWVYNRERLWNEVERVESSINSQLSREIRVALPSELSEEKQTELIKEFSQDNFVAKGMVADIAIHRDRLHNPHAHIMLTIRPFNEDGTWGQKSKKEYIFDNDGNKIKLPSGQCKSRKIFTTDWGKKDTLKSWRSNWAEKVNDYYKEAGLNVTVSEKSYEEQGIDKVPTHRLTWEEYKSEKEARIQAQMKEEEYEPVTHMGMVNQDIRDTNELRQLIKQEIVELESYKEALEKEIEEQYIPQVRDNFPLSKGQAESLQFVAKRVHSYVTFENAKDNLDKVNAWGNSLDFKIRKVVAESNMIERAESDYNTESTRAIRYGLSPQHFSTDKSEKISNINKQSQTLEKSYIAYQEAQQHSKIAYEVQKEIVHQEFSHIYPQYSHVTENHNDLIVELKHKYNQEYLKSGVKRELIPEFEDPKLLELYSSERAENKAIVKEWKDNQHSLLIANRTVSKASRDYSELYQGGTTRDKIYDSRLKLETAKEQVQHFEGEKRNLDEKMNHSLQATYNNQPSTLIEQIPTKLKARLVEMNLEGETTGELSKDLRKVEKRLEREGKDISKLYDKEFTPSGMGAMGIAKLFGNLTEQAQSNDKQQDIDEQRRKRKSKFKEKTLSKDKELEM
jgi:MobA/MobL family